VISQKIKSLLKLVNRIIEKHIPNGASFFPEGIFRAPGANHFVTSAHFPCFTNIPFVPYNQTIPGWLEYNTFRPHSSLNYRPPAPEATLH
jgi:hypothetical protein